MTQTNINPQEVPTTTPALTPEQVVAQLRALQAQISEMMTPLTADQRRILRKQASVSQPVVQASLNVLGAADIISQAVGQQAADVQVMIEEANRWNAVEGELRATLSGVAGTNLIRRQRIALVTGRAYQIGARLATDPDHASLVPHVEEVKRLKSFSRRKKHASQPPVTPVPAPTPVTVSENPQVPQTPVAAKQQ